MIQDEVLRLMPKEEGHFALESGHHGELWLKLELLFLRPERVQPLAAALAARLASHDVGAVCGPLIEGAFVGLGVASVLGVPFAYSEPVAQPRGTGLFPIAYRIPEALCSQMRGKRVAIVDDVINAGSAVRGTLSALRACGAQPVAVAALLVLGEAAHELAASENLTLDALASLPNRIWPPSACPLCARGVPLSRLGGERAIAIRPMEAAELDRIGEIDRSEHVTQEYLYRRGALEARTVDVVVPSWSRSGDHEHSVRGRVDAWRPILDRGGTLVGAFDADTFAGFAIYRPHLAEGMACLSVLYVSRPYRRTGVGSLLAREVARLARADGARRLYVSATPSVSTVEFYRSRGFEPTDEPNEALFQLEPNDIHMILEL